jgi:uncharacterized delta-60 repeat protein
MSTYYCESCLTGENTYIDGGDLSIQLPGIPNFGFNIGSGFNSSVRCVALQSDGKILVGGDFTSYSGVSRNKIIRLNTDGSVDNSFVIGTGFTQYVSDIEVQTDGKILVVGGFTSYSGVARNYIIRLNTDGSVDNSFSIGSGFSNPPLDLELQADGKILVGGFFTSYSGVSLNNGGLIRLNTNGSRDNTLNIGLGFYNSFGEGEGSVDAIQFQPDGKIIVGGSFDQYNGTSIGSGIVRLTSGGTIDSTFNSGSGIGDANVNTIALQSDGKILVGGSFTSYSGVSKDYIVRLNSNGSIDTSFVIGTGFNNFVYTIALQSDGKILVGGDFTSYSGVSGNRIIRLNSNGSIDHSFSIGVGFDAAVESIVVNSNGKIIVVGNFGKFNGYFNNRICQLDSLVSNNPILYSTDFRCYEALSEVFNSINPLFDIGTGFNANINDIETQTDGKILVGGDFTSYSGVSRNRIIRLNTDYTVDTSFVIGSGFDTSVTSFALQSDGKILVGGFFSSYSGVAKNRIIRLNTDGSVDNSFVIGTGFSQAVRDISVQSDGKILVGGNFPTYSGVSKNGIVRLNTDGSIDNSFVIGDGFTGDTLVYTVKIQTDGKILVGGQFTSYSGVSKNFIVRLNSNGSIDSSFVIGTGFNNTTLSIALQPDGKILVGGYFTTYSGVSSNRIIRLNTDGSIDSSFSIGTGFVGTIQTITLQSDGKILVGGSFSSYDGVSNNYIVRLNSNGSIDSSFVVGTGFNNAVFDIELQLDGNILVGGAFTEIANLNAYRFTGLLSVPLESEYTAIELFSECEICNGYVIPISANTPSIICFVCSGETSTVDPVRPVWTGLNGGAVTQMNAVLLGGNGLNS